MRKIMLVSLAFAAVQLGIATSAVAADDKKPTAQQAKMAACNKEAGEKQLKGAERKKFMSECLKAGSGSAGAEEKKPTAQQTKMAACNKEAGNKQLKGDERKKFMSECLKG